MEPENGNKDKTLILVVDDHKLTRELLKTYLEHGGYSTIEAQNGKEALERIEQYSPDLVLLDILMPVVDGYKVCKHIKDDPRTTLLPVIVITGLEDFDAKMQALSLGADDFINKPINEKELLTRVKNHLRIKQLTDQLESAENVIISLVRSVEAKDPYTRGHSERVAEYAAALARECELSDEDRQILRRAALLHDLGKIGVDDSIIRSPAKLTEEELEKVHNHPFIGIEIMKPLGFLSEVIDVVQSHHERYDGKGYPGRLAREQIPLTSRIIAVADTYDALTTDRPYRKAVSPDDAFKEMRRSASSGQLDPDLVEKFIEIMNSHPSPDPRKSR
jgi:putative two-component system response regulator